MNSFSKEIITNSPEETLGLGIKIAPLIGIGKIAKLSGFARGCLLWGKGTEDNTLTAS